MKITYKGTFSRECSLLSSVAEICIPACVIIASSKMTRVLCDSYLSRCDLAEWLERLTAKVATVLGSIPASTDTVESEGWQMKQ